jgi:CRISPR system Cascade subunit CasE
VEGDGGSPIELLIQSHVAPDWSGLPPSLLADEEADGGVSSKSVDGPYGRIDEGTRLAFRLRANPTRKIDTRTRPTGAPSNGRRVELRSEDALVDWLARKGGEGGFELQTIAPGSAVYNVRIQREPKLRGIRRDAGEGRRITFGPVLYEGVLRVTDPERFRAVLATGIGSAKAYGFGLLSVAPARGGR